MKVNKEKGKLKETRMIINEERALEELTIQAKLTEIGRQER